MRQIGLKLTLEEEKELLKKVDPRDTGLVEFRDYKGVAYEVFESIEANRLAVFKLQEDREEEIFGSILMLVNDEVQDIEETMLQKFKQKDENETGLTTIAITKTILEEINKKAKDNNKAEPLMAIELAEITKILTDRYGYQEIPYSKIHKHILDFKVQELAAGRIHSSVNKLEAHLRDLFAEFDDKNLGKVKMESFE